MTGTQGHNLWPNSSANDLEWLGIFLRARKFSKRPYVAFTAIEDYESELC